MSHARSGESRSVTDAKPLPRFAILGPLEASLGGAPLALGGFRQRSVLVALLLAPNEVVALDRLIDELWGEEPPAQATNALQTYVSNLRRVLEPARGPREPARVLRSQVPGYVLGVDLARYDAARFEQLATDGRGLLRAGEPERARERLGDALALWRGPALAEYADLPSARTEAARLAELRVLALEDRVAADLALGEHAALVGELERMLADEPLREQLWAHLMLALYRAGRQAEALGAFTRCRSMLDERLGIHPGPGLQRLHQQILEHAPALLPADQPAPRGRPARPASPAGPAPAVGALVGRERTLAQLAAAWDSARHGRGGLVLLSGEPGIGKTRTTEELVRGIGDGERAAWGRCSEGEGVPVLWPWSQLLRHLVPGALPAGIERALAADGCSASDLAPLLAREATATATATDPASSATTHLAARFRLCRAATVVLTELARDAPLIAVLEDLHWADAASVELLAVLAERLADSAVLVVGTFRDEEIVDTHPFAETLASVARQRGVQRIALTGLGVEDVAILVDERAGDRASRELARAVHERTRGNPFYVGELLRLLEAEGALDDPVAARSSRVPLGVRDVIRRRLRRLPDPAGAVLALAAVIGADFDLALLDEVGGLEGDATFDAIDLALATGLLVDRADPGRYGFAHALVRDTLYEGLSSARRSRLHARVAGALADRPQDDATVVELGHHALRAIPAMAPDVALAHVLRAAEVALRGLGAEQALELLRRALTLAESLPPGADRDERELWIQVRIGTVVGALSGHTAPGATAAFTRAHELSADVAPDSERLAAIYGLFVAGWNGADYATAARIGAQLMQIAHVSRDPRFLCAAHNAIGMTAMCLGELATACRHIEQATMIADSLADPLLTSIMHTDPRVSARATHGLALAAMGETSQAREVVTEAVALALASGHPYTIAGAVTIAAMVPSVLGDHRWTREIADTAIAAGEAGGFEAVMMSARVARAWARAHDGELEWAQAEVVYATEAHDATGMRVGRTVRTWHAAEISRLAGRIPAALALCDAAIAQADESGEQFFAAELLRLRGALLAAGDPPDLAGAKDSMRRALELADAQGACELARRARASLDELARPPEAAIDEARGLAAGDGGAAAS